MTEIIWEGFWWVRPTSGWYRNEWTVGQVCGDPGGDQSIRVDGEDCWLSDIGDWGPFLGESPTFVGEVVQ